MFYPFKFQPNYKDYIWGGRNLEKLGKILPLQGIVAESWEISCHPNGVSTIQNGELAGQPFTAILEKYGRLVMGNSLPESNLTRFPLLVKFIDANDRLSVQVHPDDDYARAHENGELGKNEMWYIISAKPGSKLILNLQPGITKDIFVNAVKNNMVESCLQTVPVSTGDVINIPAGLVHAIGEGIILAEIQQNSDLTYRVYDYNRVDKQGIPRPLHIEKAIEVIDYQSIDRPPKTEGLEVILNEYNKIKYLVANNFFTVQLVQLKEQFDQVADGSKFCLYLCLEGKGEIIFENGAISIQKGESIFIPATLGKYRFNGKLEMLKAYIPDINKDVMVPLKKVGYSDAEIFQKVSGLK